MPHPQTGNKVKLIKLETGLNEHKMFIGKTGEVTRCDKYGQRRFYWVRFMRPVSEILFLFRPEIELIGDDT